MALLKLGYWNIRGLAAPLRMMLCYRNVPFENKAYCLNEEFDRSIWLVDDKPAMKEKNSLANLPYIVDGDIVVCQSNACFSYLGRKFNLWGSNDTEIIACEQLLCEVMDLRNAVVGFSYGRSGNPNNLEEVQAFLQLQAQGILPKLEQWLSRQTQFSEATPFFVGNHATAPDFHIFEMLDQLNLIAQCNSLPLVTDAAALSTVHSFYLWFRQLDENNKYFSSGMADAPCNNLMAVFGSAPQGGQWKKGDKLPNDISGVY